MPSLIKLFKFNYQPEDFSASEQKHISNAARTVHIRTECCRFNLCYAC